MLFCVYICKRSGEFSRRTNMLTDNGSNIALLFVRMGDGPDTPLVWHLDGLSLHPSPYLLDINLKRLPEVTMASSLFPRSWIGFRATHSPAKANPTRGDCVMGRQRIFNAGLTSGRK